MIRLAKRSLIAYLTCGDPDLATTHAIALAAIDAGAAMLELGVPFSDPVADGPVIQRASERALARDTTLNDVLQQGAAIRAERPQAGLIVFSYFNPILRFGLEKFAATAKSAGFDGALVTDLPPEEADAYLYFMRGQDLATIFLAAPTSSDARLRAVAKGSRGFVYAVSRTAVTGAQINLASDARALVRRLREFTALPIAVGFGIANSEQFQAVTKFADAAVVGSAIVRRVENSSPAEAPAAVADLILALTARHPTRRAKRTRATRG